MAKEKNNKNGSSNNIGWYPFSNCFKEISDVI